MTTGTDHEPPEMLSADTRDMHRALLSLREELEAIDWYRQRAEACADTQLKEVFRHNQKEETEHATMLMEWIRRHDDHFGETMKTYLFTEAPIAGLEQGARAGGASAPPVEALGIGSMKGK